MGILSVLDLVLPRACAACRLPGSVACAGCIAALEPLPGPWCGGCGASTGVTAARCHECRGSLQGCRQAVRYAGPAAALVGGLKDARRRALAPVLAAQIVAAVPPPRDAVLVPVPLGRRRMRERGFNQSLLIARHLGRAWGLPVQDLVMREREGHDQRGASATARARQVAGAFTPIDARVPPRVVLVDDVRTTGATLAACAAAARAGGAVWVGAVCFARAVSGGA